MPILNNSNYYRVKFDARPIVFFDLSLIIGRKADENEQKLAHDHVLQLVSSNKYDKSETPIYISQVYYDFIVTLNRLEDLGHINLVYLYDYPDYVNLAYFEDNEELPFRGRNVARYIHWIPGAEQAYTLFIANNANHTVHLILELDFWIEDRTQQEIVKVENNIFETVERIGKKDNFSPGCPTLHVYPHLTGSQLNLAQTEVFLTNLS